MIQFDGPRQWIAVSFFVNSLSRIILNEAFLILMFY